MNVHAASSSRGLREASSDETATRSRNVTSREMIPLLISSSIAFLSASFDLGISSLLPCRKRPRLTRRTCDRPQFGKTPRAAKKLIFFAIDFPNTGHGRNDGISSRQIEQTMEN